MNKIKNAAYLRSGAIYLSANLYDKSLLFFIPLLFSFFIPPEELAKLVICNTLILIVNIFLGQNVTALITIDYHKLNCKEFAKLLSNIIILTSIISFVVTGILFIISSTLFKLYGTELKHLILVVVVCLFSVLNQAFNAYLRSAKNSSTFFRLSIFRTTCELLICVIGVYYFATWEWRLYAAAFSNMVVVIISYCLLNSRLRLDLSIDKFTIRSILFYILPLIPHALGGWLIQMIDKTLIPIVLSREMLGIYSLSFQIGMATSIVGISYNQAWSPHLYGMLSIPGHTNDSKIVNMIYKYMVSIFSFALLNSLIGILFVNNFMSPIYRGYEFVIVLTAIGYSIQACCAMMLNFIFFEKKNKILMFMTPSIGCLHFLVCLTFLKCFGLVGASLSFVVSNIIFFLSAWFFSVRVHPMPWFKKFSV